MKYLVFLLLVAAAAAAPAPEAQDGAVREKRGVLGLSLGHAPVLAAAPLAVHAPVYHTPLAVHAPVYHAPLALAHAPLLGHSSLLLH